MHDLLNDLRHGLRTLARQPLFTALAVLTLALGIGANTTVFSVVHAVLLRPLPYPQPERLVLVRERSTTFHDGSVSYPNYLDWCASQSGFTGLTLVRRESFNFSGRADNPQAAAPEQIDGARVTANFLTVLGLPPRLGRDLTEADDAPGAARVVVLSDRLWRRRFGASPDVLGQRVTVDGEPREIVGIASPDIRFPRKAELFVPLAELRVAENVLERNNHPGFSTLGRLKPGVTLEQATTNLDTISAELERRYPATNTGRRVSASLLLEAAVGNYRQSLSLLLGAVGCVLLIACANVANLQLTRALGRSREFAVRAALGAGRGRLARQLLTESLLLALLGAGGGVLLALWSLDLVLAISPATVPRFQETRIDLVALGFTAAVAIGAGLMAGLWPAWRTADPAALARVLHDSAARGSSGSAHRRRTSAALVIAQVALAVVLLVGGGVTLKSFWRAQQAPLGFEPDGVLLMTLALPRGSYQNDEKTAAFFSQLLARLPALPGVVAAAISDNAPFDDNESDSYFHLTDTPPPPPGEEPSAEIGVVSPDYFRVLNMPILRGRGFGPEDAPGQGHTVIIDETFARRYFAGKDPLGQRIDDNQTLDKSAPPLTVIGVVPRTRNEAPGEDNIERLQFPQMYFCAAQNVERNNVLLLRTAPGVHPLSLTETVRREVLALDPEQPVTGVSTMANNVAASPAARRLTMGLLGVFAALALTLASVGLYGVMALNVTQRTRELGIRLALGAARGNVFGLVLRQGMVLVVLGLSLGLLVAAGASGLLASLLYGVHAGDPTTFVGVALLLAAVALLASYLPARQAMQIDPMVALKEE